MQRTFRNGKYIWTIELYNNLVVFFVSLFTHDSELKDIMIAVVTKLEK
jgi:hypothetical protein